MDPDDSEIFVVPHSLCGSDGWLYSDSEMVPWQVFVAHMETKRPAARRERAQPAARSLLPEWTHAWLKGTPSAPCEGATASSSGLQHTQATAIR